MIDYNKVISVNFYKLYYWLEVSLAKIFLSTIFRIEIEGKENIIHDKSFLIISNHASYLDPPLIGISVLRPIAYMAKEGLFKVPLLNILIRYSGAYSVNRGKNDPSFIRNTVYALRNNWLVTIFPEGTRSIDGKLQTMKAGVARILLEEQVSILPIALINTHNAFSKKGRIKLFTKIKVKIGKIIEPEEYKLPSNLSNDEKIEFLKEFYKKKIYELLPEEQR